MNSFSGGVSNSIIGAVIFSDGGLDSVGVSRSNGRSAEDTGCRVVFGVNGNSSVFIGVGSDLRVSAVTVGDDGNLGS